MPWLIFLLLLFTGLHFLLFFPVQLAIFAGGVVTVLCWIVWKLKWVILGIIGLEEIFGGGKDGF